MNAELFSFAPISISEYNQNKFLDGFVLFLDEFSDIPENKLIRNIARAIGMPIVLANTNTKVANLVDRPGARASGTSSGKKVWSTVVTKLDPATIEALDLLNEEEARDDHLTFTQAFEKLLSWFPRSSNRMRSFLLELRDVHFDQLRPGIAAFLAEIIKEFAKNEPLGERFSVGAFLDYLLPKLAYKLNKRKNCLATDFGASLGQIALLLPESYYDQMAGEDSDKSWRQPRFLENHLFYLKNPADDSNRFLTFASDGESPLLLMTNSSWLKEYTVFRPEEHFTFLACLFLPFFSTIGTMFYWADQAAVARNTSVTRSVNPNNIFLDGNSLEAQAAVAIARASHYQLNYVRESVRPVFSCTGHEGLSFFVNLVYELSNGAAGFGRMEFDFDSKLESFLERLLIPFLYGVNHENSLLEKYSTTGSRTVLDLYARQYVRTSNSKQIDGKFFAKKSGIAGEVVVACECKNRKDKVDASLLRGIMEGFIKNQAKLGIVICAEAVDSPYSTSQFAIDCANFNRHVYRLEVEGIETNFKQFYTKVEYNRAPSMVVVILETSVIDKIPKIR